MWDTDSFLLSFLAREREVSFLASFPPCMLCVQLSLAVSQSF